MSLKQRQQTINKLRQQTTSANNVNEERFNI